MFIETYIPRGTLLRHHIECGRPASSGSVPIGAYVGLRCSAQLYQQLANLRHARAAITARLQAGRYTGDVCQPMLVDGGADRVAADAKA